MFDIGFWELCLVGLVSLLVIGPEKLPKAARVVGFWVGKAQNMVASVKMEIKEELRAEEMRQIFKEQSGIEEAQNLLEEGSETVNKIASTLESLPSEQVKKIDESK
jgi:sec-independent protein translocase protein TatB